MIEILTWKEHKRSTNSRQSFFPPTQVPLEEYTSPMYTQKNNQPELNLFDLTATIVDEETDNQTEILLKIVLKYPILKMMMTLVSLF